MCVCPHCTDKHSETAFDNHISTMDKGSTRLSNMDCADNSDEEWIFAIITDTYGPHHANTHTRIVTHYKAKLPAPSCFSRFDALTEQIQINPQILRSPQRHQ